MKPQNIHVVRAHNHIAFFLGVKGGVSKSKSTVKKALSPAGDIYVIERHIYGTQCVYL